MADEQRSAQDLVRFLRGRGVSTSEIAAELHRSPRMVRKILNGETSGALYRSTLEELATIGRAGRDLVRERHDAAREAGKLLDLYRHHAAAGGGAS